MILLLLVIEKDTMTTARIRKQANVSNEESDMKKNKNVSTTRKLEHDTSGTKNNKNVSTTPKQESEIHDGSKSNENDSETDEMRSLTGKEARGDHDGTERKEDDNVSYYRVCELNMSLKEPWGFVGRIVCKNHVKYYKSLSSNGKLVEFLVQDDVGDSIRLLLFNAGVDKFDGMLKSGGIYRFLHGF